MAMQDRPRLDNRMVEVGGAHAAKEESQYVKVDNLLTGGFLQ